MEQNPSSESVSCSFDHEFRLVWKPKFGHLAQKSPPLDLILKQLIRTILALSSNMDFAFTIFISIWDFSTEMLGPLNF
jgi:hypothetical protein